MRYGCLEYNAFVCNAIKRMANGGRGSDQNWRTMKMHNENVRYLSSKIKLAPFLSLFILSASTNLTLLETSCRGTSVTSFYLTALNLNRLIMQLCTKLLTRFCGLRDIIM